MNPLSRFTASGAILHFPGFSETNRDKTAWNLESAGLIGTNLDKSGLFWTPIRTILSPQQQIRRIAPEFLPDALIPLTIAGQRLAPL